MVKNFDKVGFSLKSYSTFRRIANCTLIINSEIDVNDNLMKFENEICWVHSNGKALSGSIDQRFSGVVRETPMLLEITWFKDSNLRNCIYTCDLKKLLTSPDLSTGRQKKCP